jgi:hypothetical protein
VNLLVEQPRGIEFRHAILAVRGLNFKAAAYQRVVIERGAALVRRPTLAALLRVKKHAEAISGSRGFVREVAKQIVRLTPRQVIEGRNGSAGGRGVPVRIHDREVGGGLSSRKCRSGVR